MVAMQVELYTDGSCLHNPGAGGWAYIVRYWDTPEGSDMPQAQEIECSQGYRLSTNNRMEIMGAVFGIRKIIELVQSDPTWAQVSQINVMSDSEYFCNAINQRWIQKWSENNWMTSGFGGRQPKPVKNKDLWEDVVQLQNILRELNINMTVNWVKGHNGNEFNERCDKLAVGASSGTNHIKDEVYEQTTAGYNRK